MGLSTKQVSSDGHGWNQALLQASNLELPKLPMKRKPSSSSQQQEGEQLKCPRCESTNTKFCYYNNYNKSQPRHFCKACKRHWTKGGTLRNVPIGGGRKNRRNKSNTIMKTASKTTTCTTTSKEISNNNMTLQDQQPNLNMSFTPSGFADNQKNLSNVGAPRTNELKTTASSEHPAFCEEKDEIFVGQQDLQHPYTKLANFESMLCSISSTMSSMQSPSTTYNSLEETMMNNTNFSSMGSWSTGVGPTSSNWGWDDFDKFVSIDNVDLITIPWDDPELKP